MSFLFVGLVLGLRGPGEDSEGAAGRLDELIVAPMQSHRDAPNQLCHDLALSERRARRAVCGDGAEQGKRAGL